MKKLLIYCGILALACVQLNAQSQPVTQNSFDAIKSSLSLSQGYRHDTIKSTLKDGSASIHRKFKDIDIYQSRLIGTVSFEEWFASARFGYGDITHGKEHLRFHQLSHFPLKGTVKSGHTLDAALEFGKQFAVTDMLSISPLAGYMWEKETLKAKGNKQLHGIRIPQSHRFHIRDSFKWNAPYLGVTAATQASKDMNIYAGYKFLFAVKEQNHIDWRHVGKTHYSSKRSKGFGNMGTVGAGYSLTPNWVVKAEYELSDIHTKGGHIHDKDNHSARHAKTTKTTSEVRLALEYIF